MTNPVAAPDVVDPRREAVATYLLDEVEVYCSSRDSALRRAGEIIAAIDAAENAELTRLREEVAELREAQKTAVERERARIVAWLRDDAVHDAIRHECGCSVHRLARDQLAKTLQQRLDKRPTTSSR